MTDLIPLDEPGDLQIAGQIANQLAVGAVFGDYLVRKAQSTLLRQRGDLAIFAAYLQEAGVLADQAALQTSPDGWRGVTWGLVEGFKIWMLKMGYAVGSVNVRLSTVKTYARLAFRAGAISAEEHALIRSVEGYRRKDAEHLDEKRSVTRVGSKKLVPIRISREQAAWLKAQPDTSQGRRDALLMCLLLDHGLRASEVAGLTVETVNLKGRELAFYRPKVSKWQTHRLTGDAYRAARAWFRSGDVLPMGPLLRASLKSGALGQGGLTTRSITGRVRVLGQAVGLEGLSAHDCRHYWATHAARSGTDPFALQEAGGWSSLAMPRRYVEAARIANEGVKGFDED